ncbi:hypothetical protein MTO96_014837 [Rhipicephalus appendiculatus]
MVVKRRTGEDTAKSVSAASSYQQNLLSGKKLAEAGHRSSNTEERRTKSWLILSIRGPYYVCTALYITAVALRQLRYVSDGLMRE